MNLILIPSKLVDIPKNVNLWRIFTMQLYWIQTSAWVISCKFAMFLQNTFSEQHLWRAASGHLHHNKKQGKQHYIDQCICFIAHTFLVLLCTHYQAILLPVKNFSYKFIFSDIIKGTLMQIWKSLYMFMFV